MVYVHLLESGVVQSIKQLVCEHKANARIIEGKCSWIFSLIFNYHFLAYVSQKL